MPKKQQQKTIVLPLPSHTPKATGRRTFNPATDTDILKLVRTTPIKAQGLHAQETFVHLDGPNGLHIHVLVPNTDRKPLKKRPLPR